jgi:hypothetical protein
VPLISSYLVHPVVLAGGRTPVRVVARGVGRLRVGDLRFWVLGTFDRVVLVDAAPRIDVAFNFTRKVLTPALVPDPAPPEVSAVVVETPHILLDVPRPAFDVAIRLPRGAP